MIMYTGRKVDSSDKTIETKLMVVGEGGVGGRGEGPAVRSGTAIAQVNTFRREGLNTWFVEIKYGELP